MRNLKHLVITIIYILFFSPSIAQDKHQEYSALIDVASKYYKEGDYKKSIKAYQAAFELNKNSASDFYNAACSATLSGQNQLAFDLLKTSLSLGWSNSDHLERDEDLYSLHPLPQWKAIVTTARQNSKESSVTEVVSRLKSLIEAKNTEEILSMLRTDSLINISDFKNRLENVYLFLEKNNITKLGKQITSAKTSSTLINRQQLRESHQTTYKFVPPFFGQHTAKLLDQAVGFELQILLVKTQGKWQLHDVILINEIFAPGYSLEDDIKAFFSEVDSVIFRFFIWNKTKQIEGTGLIKLSDLTFSYTNQKLRYVNAEEIVSKAEDSDNYMSLTLIRKDNKSNLLFPYFFDSTLSIRRLEFLISSTNNRLCLISNGLGYGFYETDLAVEVKRCILTKLYPIKE